MQSRIPRISPRRILSVTQTNTAYRMDTVLAIRLHLPRGEQDSYTFGENASSTNSHNWGTADTVSGAHSTGSAVSHGRGRGSSISNGTTDSQEYQFCIRMVAVRWAEQFGYHWRGTIDVAPVEHLLYDEDPEVVGLSNKHEQH